MFILLRAALPNYCLVATLPRATAEPTWQCRIITTGGSTIQRLLPASGAPPQSSYLSIASQSAMCVLDDSEHKELCQKLSNGRSYWGGVPSRTPCSFRIFSAVMIRTFSYHFRRGLFVFGEGEKGSVFKQTVFVQDVITTLDTAPNTMMTKSASVGTYKNIIQDTMFQTTHIYVRRQNVNIGC